MQAAQERKSGAGQGSIPLVQAMSDGYPRMRGYAYGSMRVIAFVTQKGGSGKSTLAFCCAVAASESGRSALILDSDRRARRKPGTRIARRKRRAW